MIRVKGWFVLFMITFSLLGSTACGGNGDGNTEKNTGDGYLLTYEQISAEKAKEIMDSEEACVIIDARTDAEFATGHIEGAILIPEYEIAERAEGELPDKNALILVYCRSGRRSKIASEELVKLGYTNVKEFGGIIDWPYDTVK